MARATNDAAAQIAAAICHRDNRFPAATVLRVGALHGQFPGLEEAVVTAAAKATSQQRRAETQ